jgi:hypothetical protein
MTTASGADTATAAFAPVETRAPRRRTMRAASVILAIVVVAYFVTQQAAPATSEPPVIYGALMLFITAFYFSLLVVRWIPPDAAWWIGVISVAAAFVLAALMALMTAYIAPLIAAGYVIVVAGRAFWTRVDRARRIT